MNIEYKKLRSATNILGDFCYVQFCYCTFGCTNKSQNRKWHQRNSAGAVIMLPRHVYSPNSEASVSNDGKIPGFRKFLFLSSVLKFDNKWAKSKQRSQSPKLLRLTPGLTIVSSKSNIYSPRQGYLSPGNSIILEIAATLLFIGVTICCWFWGSFCWTSSTPPTDLFIFVNLSGLQSNTKNILPYHISTLSSKIQYTTWYYNSQRQKKHLIETNNMMH